MKENVLPTAAGYQFAICNSVVPSLMQESKGGWGKAKRCPRKTAVWGFAALSHQPPLCRVPRVWARPAVAALWCLFLAAIVIAPGFVSVVRAQSPRSIDDELLDDLQSDPIDEYDRELFGPADRPTPGEEPPDAQRQEQLLRQLGDAAIAEDENPLLTIARRMQNVEGNLDRHQCGPSTQTEQGQIVADLDALIEQARKACKKGMSSGQPSQQISSRTPIGQAKPKAGTGNGKPGRQPATDSNRRPRGNGTAQKVDMGQMRRLIKRLWGELPQHQREQMLQLPIEQFLPKHELLIEEYFRRLSQEKGVGE